MNAIYNLCLKVLLFAQAHGRNVSEEDFVKICGENSDYVLSELKGNRVGAYVTGYKGIWSINSDSLAKAINYYQNLINMDYMKPNNDKKVFIVHGHDEAAKEKVARFVENLDLEAVILHEQTSNGKTIIEKLEAYSNVGFAIVLYTPCDRGRDSNSQNEEKRARQNVIFEHGYFISHLGRDRVCALLKDDVVKPGDLDGVVWVDMDMAGAWKNAIAREMVSLGYDIDFSKIK